MIIRITPDLKKAAALSKMANARKNILPKLKSTNYPTIIAETYYEIIKELLSAILLCRGKKAVGENQHKDIIEEARKDKTLLEKEIQTITELRIKRNNSYYQGQQIEKIFLSNHEKELNNIISKLNKSISDILPQ